MKNSNLLKKNIFYFIFCLLGIVTHAQKVSNITYRQEKSSIIVSYDLETKTPCKVNLFVSTNGGANWQGPLTKVTGDVGAKIASGSRNITWNVLEEFEELRGDKIMFQVRAFGDDIETVKIGTQEWTKKNLNVSRYRNGDIIPEVKDHKKWVMLTSGAWCYYNNDPKNGAIYGKLYNWYAVNDPRGIAPEGFHIPSDDEWAILDNYLGGQTVAGGKMKATGTALWESPNTDATNSSGFRALPGGCRINDGTFFAIGKLGLLWSSSEVDTANAWCLYLYYVGGVANRIEDNKRTGSLVRCLRD
jgi:uncharacterized protein (TIGR02145 family)